jgi:hypothetical protein
MELRLAALHFTRKDLNTLLTKLSTKTIAACCLRLLAKYVTVIPNQSTYEGLGAQQGWTDLKPRAPSDMLPSRIACSPAGASPQRMRATTATAICGVP